MGSAISSAGLASDVGPRASGTVLPIKSLAVISPNGKAFQNDATELSVFMITPLPYFDALEAAGEAKRLQKLTIGRWTPCFRVVSCFPYKDRIRGGMVQSHGV